MRQWSLFSLVAFLTVLIAEVTALPTPQEGSSEPSLERRAVTKPKAAGKAKAGMVKASNFKKSSGKTYQNAALKGKNPMLPVKAGNRVKSKAPKRLPKGKDAEHIIKAQNTWHPSRKGGHSSNILGPALKAVTGRINGPKNMAFLTPKTNRAKGRPRTPVKSGKTPAKDRNVVKPKEVRKVIAAVADKVLKVQMTEGLGFLRGALKEVENMAVPYDLSVL